MNAVTTEAMSTVSPYTASRVNKVISESFSVNLPWFRFAPVAIIEYKMSNGTIRAFAASVRTNFIL